VWEPVADSVPGMVRRGLMRQQGRLRMRLAQALLAGDAAAAAQIRDQLVSVRLAFWCALAPRSAEEQARLVARFLAQAAHDRGTSLDERETSCWACGAAVSPRANDVCGACAEIVCICGACRDPRTGSCPEQPERLGQEEYRHRLAAREG
jgi:hypothetical protein